MGEFNPMTNDVELLTEGAKLWSGSWCCSHFDGLQAAVVKDVLTGQ